MVVVLSFLTITTVLAGASVKLLMLPSGHFKAFLAPKPVNSLEINQPIILTQQNSDPAITVSRMLDMQLKYVSDYRLILIRQLWLIPLRASGLP